MLHNLIIFVKILIMNNLLSFFVSLLIVSFCLTSCGKDDPEIPNEEELITTLNYVLTPTDGGAAITLTFQDLDGDGSMEPMVSEGMLTMGTTYSGRITLLNETESPSENITLEVAEENVDHQFFFQTDVPGLSVTYMDEDDDGNPLGLTTQLTTGLAPSTDGQTGSLTITLVHEPEKDGDNVSGGDITNAGGEIDIAVTFPINVR